MERRVGSVMDRTRVVSVKLMDGTQGGRVMDGTLSRVRMLVSVMDGTLGRVRISF